MHAYTIQGWESFFLAVVGAAAALTGLVFVALSINLGRILDIPGLPGRAGETIVMLTEVVVIGIVALVPQDRPVLAAELIVVGAIGWLMPLLTQIRELRRLRTLPDGGDRVEHSRLLMRMSMAQFATIPPIVAGITLALQAGGGLYWLALGIVLLLVNGIANAWVLLVEILR